MNYKDKLIDFIDGNLDLEEEQSLFSELTYDDALRQDLKSYITIDKSIKANPGLYTPSSAATNSVFATLGYTLPAESAVVIPAAKGGFSFGRMFTGLTGGIVGAILTMGLVYFLLDWGVFDQDINNTRSDIPIVESFEQTPQFMDIYYPVEKSDESSLSAKQTIRYVFRDVEPLSSAIENEDQVALIKLSNFQPIENTNDIILSGDFSTKLHPENEPLQPYFQEVSGYKYLGLAIELKNHESWHLPKHTITPAEVPIFNHLGIAVLYSFDEKWELGAGIRRENFYLEYKGNEEDREYNYFQQPNFVSFGIVTRYKFDEIFSVKPFVQCEIGFNKYGYLGRLGLGGSVILYDDISFVVNIETGMFLFKNSDNWFSAQKAGFEYGIRYNF